MGSPKEDDNNLGAIVSKAHMEKVLSCIELAKLEGGTILTGGKRIILEGELSEGFYIEPTVIDGLNYTCRTNQEEIFGPVVSMIPFSTEKEVIDMANSTKYGLSASIFTKDVSRAHRVASAIDSGIVWVNTHNLPDPSMPIGGKGQSGWGRELGEEGLDSYLETKSVMMSLDE